MAKGSAKTHARSKSIRKATGAYLDRRAFREHAAPKPVTIHFESPEVVRQRIRETTRK